MGKEGNGKANVVRVTSGVPGLDELLGGGLPEKSLVMVSGGTGTGKTLLCLQFLYHGATQLNEPGVYLSLEQDPERVIRTAKLFGWDFEPLIAKKKISVIAPPIYKFEALKDALTNSIKEIGAKRLVIDSYSIVGSYFEKTTELRRSILTLSKHIQKFNCISLAISDIREGETAFSISGFEEFAVDGLIVLSLLIDTKRNIFTRVLLVRKMRDAAHSLRRSLFKITNQGLIIYPNAELFE